MGDERSIQDKVSSCFKNQIINANKNGLEKVQKRSLTRDPNQIENSKAKNHEMVSQTISRLSRHPVS